MKKWNDFFEILSGKQPILPASIPILAALILTAICSQPSARAQLASTNWFINFNVPGGASANGWTNYFGPGAYTNTTSEVIVTNDDSSITTNIVNDGYYWNPIADNATNSGSLLGDGVTPSDIVFANSDLNGAPGYSPIAFGGDVSTYPNYDTFWALLLPYQHDGVNAGGGASATETNTLYNVPPGTYDLYLYGINGDPRIANAFANSQDDRGTVFKVWSDLTPNKTLTDVNSTNAFFVKGGNYVLFKNVVTSNGVINFSYAANTTVFAKYNGATKLGSNGEGDFDGLQLVFVSTNTTPISSSVTLTNLYPDGTYQYQSSPTLSFAATSTNGIDTNQISIALSYTLLGGQLVGQSITTNLTYATGGITVSGDFIDYTNLQISTPLVTNALYSAIITVGDLSGDSQTIEYSFDTIDTSYDYIFEAEDFNYGSVRTGGGHFFDNPQTNAYAGQSSISGTDFINGIGGPAAYRDSVGGLATEICGDLPTLAYLPTNSSGVFIHTNYDVPAADNVTGNWGNYTRTFPAGAYNGPYIVYMRAASVGGQTNAASLSVMDGTATTSTQNPTLLGYFSPADTGGQQTYAWVPLLDTNGNRAVFIGGGVKTLRVTSVNTDFNGANANYSANGYLLIPVNTNYVIFTNIYPNGATQFQATNTFSFTINSSDNVDPANIFVSVSGTNLLGQSFETNLTGSALAITGTANSQVVNIPLESNTVYTVTIQAADASGIVTTTNLLFDTVTPSYIFEAEDFNYFGGLYADPFVDGNIDEFQGAPATLYIDDFDQRIATNGIEISDTYGRGGIDTENCGDVPRLSHLQANGGLGAQDYDCGNAAIGNWANYTRVYPAGTYNIYMRVAADADVADAISLSLVSGDTTTSNQVATNVLGTFVVPDTGGFQTYTWVPLTDNNGQLVKVSFDGSSAYTLRATWDSTSFNVNYYMFVPADTALPVINNLYPNGNYQFQYASAMSFNAASSAGINPNDISIQLTATNLVGQTFATNLTTVNGLTTGGSPTNLSVSFPLQSNTVYTAVISLTSENNETTTATVSFDTVQPAYTFEAEDFNYNGGQFMDNPSVDAYSNLTAVVGIDTYNTNFNTAGQIAYRTNGLNTEVAGDTPRASYDGLPDFDVGANAAGNWGNYTRTFPAGVYNIYIRGASPDDQPDAASLSIVTNATSADQTTALLGTFSIPATGDYQKYTWAPLKDSDGNLAQLPFNGSSSETLRVTVDGGNYNANYYMLMPANTTLPLEPPYMTTSISGGSGGAHLGGNITFSFQTLSGYNYYLDYKTNLTQAAWIQLLGPLSGNATIQTFNDTITAENKFYRLRVQ
ncbi:MAG TPA: hypothetical protein VHG71_07555 [Verrucomicrobiae bacterium]|nr:hypothetical protein [Verrucomicrobiae bacterium]